MNLRRSALAAVLAASMPAAAAAQCGEGGLDPCPVDAPRWVGELTSLSANALLGGVTAGVIRWVRGGEFADGFAAGALGGVVVYGGKRIAAERFDGAGLLGREVAAVGASMSRNAADDMGLLERLVLPLGPVRIEVRPGEASPVRARLDALAAIWTAYGVVERELTLDWGQSFSAGSPVFRTAGKVLRTGGDTLHAAGLARSGVIIVADVPAYGEVFLDRALAHERVHIIQGDQLFLLWTDPLEEVLMRTVPTTNAFGRYVDVGVSTDVLRLFAGLFPDHAGRPWELESTFLAR